MLEGTLYTCTHLQYLLVYVRGYTIHMYTPVGLAGLWWRAGSGVTRVAWQPSRPLTHHTLWCGQCRQGRNSLPSSGDVHSCPSVCWHCHSLSEYAHLMPGSCLGTYGGPPYGSCNAHTSAMETGHLNELSRQWCNMYWFQTITWTYHQTLHKTSNGETLHQNTGKLRCFLFYWVLL